MPAALLDVDGTLVDSNYVHTLAWFRSLRAHGHVVPMARIHRLVGMGADQFLGELLGEHDQAVEDGWQEEFARMRDEIPALPGAANLARVLKEGGLTVVLATSGKPDDVEVLRQTLDADRWVDDAVNSSEVESSKPAPDIFARALEVAGAEAGDAVVVGDTVWDVRAAAACDLPCVAVTCGGISRGELEEAGAVAVYRDPEELVSQLERSPLGRLLERSRSH
jgi:HAD superfamily hydrolase (TIGR01549 family)